MAIPTLFIFSSLPASGKTTLAQQLAADHGALYLRIDTIEQGIRDLCEYHQWSVPRVTIDTAGRSEEAPFRDLSKLLENN